MESLFFGPSSDLYGVYSPARADKDRALGIVFCYPFGQEYMRAHRPLRQLANNLAEMGYHVLRFDYRGSGDSAGTMTGITPQDWINDTLLAIKELRDIAALDSVALIGLRLGSLIATAAAGKCRDISKLVLWDSIIDGKDWVQQLLAGQEVLQIDAGKTNFIEPDGTRHLNGFAMPLAFQRGLTELRMEALDISSVGAVLQIASHETPTSNQLRDSWSSRHNFSYQHCAAPHDWNYVDNMGSILLPQPIMAAIKSWFS
jgi:pimeloyl-ACP methyl ester carboxylesterase